MGFIEELENLSTLIEKQRGLAAQKEPATRNALVEPFIELLGYDVRNLTDVDPEPSTDFGEKQGKKADYAILKDSAPVMLIECKPYGTNLDRHTSQLQGYFAADDHARIGILTDGGLYRFYSDLERPNKMDGEPFLEFNMFDIQEPLAKELERFAKSKFNLDSIIGAAGDLKYRKAIKDILRKELASPTKDFVRFFLPSLHSGTKSQAVIQQFTEIVKRAFNEFISEQQSPQCKLDEGLSAESDHSSERSTDNEDRKQKPGKTLIFEGRTYKLKDYKACWVKCCEILYKRDSSKFKGLLDHIFGKEKKPYFSSDESHDFRAPCEIAGTGIYIETSFSAKTIKQRVKMVAAHFGCEASVEEL